MKRLDFESELASALESAGRESSCTGLGYECRINTPFDGVPCYEVKTRKLTRQGPLGFDAGDENLYRYVHNRPTDAKDPTGLAEGDLTIVPDEQSSGYKADRTAYLFNVRWQIEDKNKTIKGIIVQRIDLTKNVVDKDGNQVGERKGKTFVFYEAWDYGNRKQGEVYPKTTATVDDSFYHFLAPAISKSCDVSTLGHVSFFKDKTLYKADGSLEGGWSTTAIPESGGKPARMDPPPYWDTAKAEEVHYLEVKWDTVAQPKVPFKVTGITPKINVD